MITPGSAGDWAMFAAVLGTLVTAAAGAYRADARERARAGKKASIEMDVFATPPTPARTSARR